MIEDVYAVEGEEEDEPPPGMLTLPEARKLKVGDLVKAPGVGVYEDASIIGIKTDDDERVQLLFQLEGWEPNWLNYRHIRRG
jgi:hypothetical protein